MSTHPRYPELGDLEVIEVYEYYDEPVLFTARNERDQLFLGTLVQDDEGLRRWMYAPMSARRFSEVRSGGVDLYQALRGVEGGCVFSVLLPKSNGANASGGWLPVARLDDSELPEPGERLELATQTLLGREREDSARRATQINKEVLSLVFDFEGTTRTEAPAGLLGQVLDTLQQVVSSVGQSTRGRATSRGKIPSAIVNQMRLSVAGVFPGSFGVELHADQSSDLFGRSAVRDAIEGFFTLLQSTGSDTELQAVLQDFRGRSGQKYRQFLLRFAGGIRQVEVRWGSPGEGIEKTVTITSEVAKLAAASIARLEAEPPTEYEVTVRLVGINVRTKTFEIWDVVENQKYSGRIDDDAMDSVEHAVINEVYVAKLRESTEVAPGGEPEIKYRLLGLVSEDDSFTDPFDGDE